MFAARSCIAAACGLALVGLAGCSVDLPVLPEPLEPAAVAAAVSRGDGIDPALHAGDFQIKAPVDIPLDAGSLPVMVYAGLRSGGDTRLALKGLVDLRQVQEQLPDILSGVLADTCKHMFALDFAAAEVQETSLRAWGTVDATFYRCTGDDEENVADRGRKRLSVRIEVFAEGLAQPEGQCLDIELEDVRLNPKGVLGSIANTLGLTSIARNVIIERGNAFLAEKPICPTLPKELEMLQPQFDTLGPVELGAGGLGADLAGSVDVSAATLIDLVALLKERGILQDIRP